MHFVDISCDLYLNHPQQDQQNDNKVGSADKEFIVADAVGLRKELDPKLPDNGFWLCFDEGPDPVYPLLYFLPG